MNPSSFQGQGSREFHGALSTLSSASVVEHCVSTCFIEPNEPVVAVGRRRILDIYQVVASSTSSTFALKHICRYKLYGIIESISVISRGKNKTDLLLLTFDYGKASLVGYSSSLGPHLFETHELFNFEEDALGSDVRAERFDRSNCGFGGKAAGLVDPDMRCAVVLLYGSHIGVIPLQTFPSDPEDEEFCRKLESDTNIIAAPEEQKQPAESKERDADTSKELDISFEMRPGCFLLNLEEYGITVAGSIRHACFLHHRGAAPVLLVLHSGGLRVGTGRIVAARYTCTVHAIALDLHNKAASGVLFKIDGLPHDSHAIVPTYDGNFIAISGNAIIHLSHSPVQWEALYANNFASITVDNCRFKRRTTARIDVRLDSSRWLWLDSNRLLFSLRYGQLGLLDVHTMDFKLYGLTVQSSCLCKVTAHTRKGKSRDFIFVGSHIADSLLIKFDLVNEVNDDENGGETADFRTEYLSETIKSSNLVPKTESKEGIGFEDEEKALYSNQRTYLDKYNHGDVTGLVKSNALSTKNLKLEVCDALLCTGPMCSVAFGEMLVSVGIEMKRAEEEAERLGSEGKHSLAAQVLNKAKESLNLKENRRYQILGSFGRAADGGVCVYEPSGLRIDENYQSDILFKVLMEYRDGFEYYTELRMWWPLKTLRFVTSWVLDRTVLVEGERVLEGSHDTFNLSEKTILIGLISEDSILQVCGRDLIFAEAHTPFHLQTKIPLSKLLSAFNIEITDEHTITIEKAQLEAEYLLMLSSDNTLFVFSYNGGFQFLAKYKRPFVRNAYLFQNNQNETCIMFIKNGIESKVGIVNLSTMREQISDSSIDKAEYVIRFRDVENGLEPEEKEAEVMLNTFDARRISDICIAKFGTASPTPHCSVHIIELGICVVFLLNNAEMLVYELRCERESFVLNKEPVEKITRTSSSIQSFNSPGYLVPCPFLQGFQGVLYVGSNVTLFVTGTRGRVGVFSLEKQLNAVSILDRKLSTVCDKNRLVISNGLALKNLRLDHLGLPALRIPLKSSILKIMHVQDMLYIALASSDEPKEEDDLAVRANCSIKLLNGDDWGSPEADQYSLMRHERPICMSDVYINLAFAAASEPDIQKFYAVGTGFVTPLAEDSPCKGRILVFEAIDGKLRKKWTIESRQTRGPVTAINSVDGKLLAALGSSPSSVRIYRYDIRSETLTALSFFDTPFAAVSIDVIKNYILIGDIYRSVHFVYWRPYKRDFKLLGKHTKESVKVLDAKILIYNQRFAGMIIVDADSNLRMMNYIHGEKELQDAAAIHLGCRGFQIVTIPHNLRAATIATQDGNIYMLASVEESRYRRLLSLQAAISTLVRHNAGLNPKGLRAIRETKGASTKRGVILDCDILYTFNHLSFQEQREIAQAIGMMPASIIDDIRTIQIESERLFR